MTKILVKRLSKKIPLPKYETSGSSGMDLAANVESNVSIAPGNSEIIPTGLVLAVPKGFEMQIRPRSGLAAKKGITVLNSPGTIDADYKGEVGVILINLSDKKYEIKPGDRIAQMIISNFSNVNWKLVEDLGRSKRGNSGFGSTGSN